MQLNIFFDENLVFFDYDFAVSNKQEVLAIIAQKLKKHHYCTNEKTVYTKLCEREAQFSTAVCPQIAIPHVLDAAINKPIIAYFRSKKPILWDETNYIKHIFVIALNPLNANQHIDLLQTLSTKFLEPNFVDFLTKCLNFTQFQALFDQKPHKLENNSTNIDYDIVAVCACPTGIAHTFLACESLKKAAESLKLKIKVETQGASGSENTLSEAEIHKAKGVILAIDRNIDKNRFTNVHNILEVSTTKAIKNAPALLNKIITKNQIPKKTKFTQDNLFSFSNFGPRIYKALMNGVSYMLPFVVFGGILLAVSFLIDINSPPGANFGSNSNVAKWFNTLGGLTFSLIVPILAAYICDGLVGRFGLLPGFLVGLIAQGKFLLNLNITNGILDFNQSASQENVSGFFGAIFGALISAVVIIIFVRYVFAKLPASLAGIKNILFIPLFATLTAVSLFWVLNIPLIYLNYGFNRFLILLSEQNLLVLLTLISGAMMGVDLGGPINKAAYFFALTTINSGPSIIMSAVMGAGMVPPLAIALATIILRKHYTKEEIGAGYSCILLGLSFISEGAIPFTAKKPKIMTPANIISSGVCGLLIGAFQIKTPAPHGGVFVFPLLQTELTNNATLQIVGGILLFIVALIISSFLGFVTIA